MHDLDKYFAVRGGGKPVLDGVLCVCKCGEPKSFWYKGATINDPELAYQLALRQAETYGYHKPKRCNCAKLLAEARNLIADIRLLSDTGWEYTRHARPNRGYHDYARTVVVARGLSEAEFEAFKRVAYEDGPGSMRFGCQQDPHDPNKFHLTTMTDSGD